jgi:hypothetical protein
METSGLLHAPNILPPGKEPGTHPTGSRVGSRTGLDGVELRKMCCLCRRWSHSTLTVYPVASLKQNLQNPGSSMHSRAPVPTDSAF